MSITVKDILSQEKLSSAKVLAGKKGLDKEVYRVATIEKPYLDHVEYSDEVALAGDIYISNN